MSTLSLPRPWGVLRQALAALVITTGVGAWLCHSVPQAALLAALTPARGGVLGATLALWLTSHVTVEVLVFGRLWRRHLTPGLSWRNAVVVVCGRLILTPLVPGLTKLVPLLYFWRSHRVPPVRVLGTGELSGAAEVTALTTLATAALLLGAAGRSPVLIAVLAAYWALIGLVLTLRLMAPRCPRLQRLARHDLFAPVMVTSAGDALWLLGLRLAHALVGVVGITLVLRELQVVLPLPRSLGFGALLLFSIYLPISVGGYGGPQAVAVLLLLHSWRACSAAQAVAVSLVWASGTLLGQVAVGAAALPWLLAALRAPEAPSG